jgi:hypothetical protein
MVHLGTSRGSVVSMFSPKHRRAIFTIVLSPGKLLSTFPSVNEPNVKKPASAMRRQASIEMPVL